MAEQESDRSGLLRERAERLLAEPSVEARAAAAASVAEEFAEGELSEEERAIALEILEDMAGDVERQVREALAAHVKDCPFLPPAIARQLAADVEAVALPVLRFSSVLSDRDLIAVVRQGSEAKQVAVAKRETVSAALSEALVETGGEIAVGALLSNRRAEITERALNRVIDRHGESEQIQRLMVGRPSLPLTVCERMIAHVSQALREQLIEQHMIPPELAEELMRQGRERALTEVLEGASPSAEVERLAASLQTRGRLTPTLVLRALCVADLDFFQAAMAALAGIPYANTGPLIYDHGRNGLEALYRKCGLPPALFTAFRVAIDEIRQMARAERTTRRLEITERIVRRLSVEYETVCPEGLEHTLSQLSRLVSRAADNPARGLT